MSLRKLQLNLIVSFCTRIKHLNNICSTVIAPFDIAFQLKRNKKSNRIKKLEGSKLIKEILLNIRVAISLLLNIPYDIQI